MNIAIIFLIFILLYLLLIWKAGKTFPMLYLFAFIYFVQYIFSTFLIYNQYDVLSVWMPIKQDQYFEYAIPAIFSLFAGVFLFNRDIDISHLLNRIDSVQATRLGYLLLGISFSFDFISWVGVSSLDSVISFTQNLKYLAAFCFLFTNSRFNYGLIFVVYVQLLYLALAGGIFIDFFVWTTYLFFFITIKLKFSFWLRASFIVLAAPLLFVVQSTKENYRDATWSSKREVGLNTFSELARESNEKNQDKPFLESDGVVRTVGRLTQGWHLALTMKRVPKIEPWSDGKEMLSDIASSFLPRVLFSDKKLAATQDKFKKYTGYTLRKGTSMTIGVLGDFYVNFGQKGAFAMLFVFGIIISKFLHYYISRFVLPDPINIIWVPFLLNYLVRANNDFYTGFNCIVKGFLIFLVVDFIRKQIWTKLPRLSYR